MAFPQISVKHLQTLEKLRDFETKLDEEQGLLKTKNDALSVRNKHTTSSDLAAKRDRLFQNAEKKHTAAHLVLEKAAAVLVKKKVAVVETYSDAKALAALVAQFENTLQSVNFIGGDDAALVELNRLGLNIRARV